MENVKTNYNPDRGMGFLTNKDVARKRVTFLVAIPGIYFLLNRPTVIAASFFSRGKLENWGGKKK